MSANDVAQGNSQDLTEQWKKGELPTGDYYVKPKNGQVFVYHINHSVKHIYHNHAGEIKEVLAPVPTLNEWQQLHKFLEEFNALEIAKENKKLKELLKECDNELKILRMLSLPMASKEALSECDDLLSKIDNTIGEKNNGN